MAAEDLSGFYNFKMHARLHKSTASACGGRFRSVGPHRRGRSGPGARGVRRPRWSQISRWVAVVLDFLGIPHDGNGFSRKIPSRRSQLKDGGSNAYGTITGEIPARAPADSSINHLDWELGKPRALSFPAIGTKFGGNVATKESAF